METSNEIINLIPEVMTWRHELHAHPELGYEEKWTSDFIVTKLESFGIEVHRGLGKTGVVGVLKGLKANQGGGGNKAIGLRADIDALPMTEENNFSYKSKFDGCMHACGHDGHTAMLLGAAKILSLNKDFDGTVYFIFQPAEEGGGGGLAMIEDGLFEQFPMDSVWGMHNWPGMDEGSVAVHKGSVMAAADRFEVTVNGNGGHAAMPQATNDPVLATTAIIQALQQIVSRKQNPLDAVVVSVTQINAGSGFNIIPQVTDFIGTIRTINPDTRVNVHKQFKDICEATALAYGCTADVSVIKGYPVTVNDIDSSEKAIQVTSSIFGSSSIKTNMAPSMGAEDFAYMLEKIPGAYIWLGAGEGKSGCMLHNTKYDFNDNILPLGITYWEELVKSELPLR
ncbi:M20 family metallopeptidase [Alphaproteobacteria bacterium]|nr:M20 family metallopeptidase [Alphaproteobacteria bacterium]